MLRRIVLVLIVLVGAISSTGVAWAVADAPGGRAVIEIFPGPDALKNALASANAGDVLNIHTGTYPEHVAVTTPDLTLRAAGDGEVTVDAGCTASTTMDVRADGTTIRGLRVVGASGGFSPIEINFGHVATGRVLSSVVEDTCGDAEYGINVFSSQTIRVVGNTATGFGDAGIYIGAILSTQRGPLVIQGNESYGNVRGIIVENSTGGKIRVTGNDVHDNQTTGIWITNSDGVRIDGNLVQNNNYSGIELDSLSDQNLMKANTASGHRYDLANDAGATGNCWVDNVYTTSLGDISC
jgi:parallel beta-helix repeat protein